MLATRLRAGLQATRGLVRDQSGAALVEYALIFPVVMLLFFGSLEIYRLYSVQQSLRTALYQVLPSYNHGKDYAYQGRYVSQSTPEALILDELRTNPFALRLTNESVVVSPDLLQVRNLPDGAVFNVTVEARIALGYFYPLWDEPWIVLRESATTFIDSSPGFYDLATDVPFPQDPGALP